MWRNPGSLLPDPLHCKYRLFKILAALSAVFDRHHSVAFALTTTTCHPLSGFLGLRQSSVIYVEWGCILSFGSTCLATSASSEATTCGYGIIRIVRLGLLGDVFTGRDQKRENRGVRFGPSDYRDTPLLHRAGHNREKPVRHG